MAHPWNKLFNKPIMFQILQHICFGLASGLFSPFIDTMLTCVFCTAFYGFLRCGELTVTNSADVFLQINDISVTDDQSCFTLLLRKSKTDPFSKGVHIPIFNTQPLTPVSSMVSYLALRFSQGTHPQSPLFPETETSPLPLSRTTFISLLKQTLAAVGLTDNHFSGHSFRIGACTSGAAGGVEDHMLQVLGRWRSSCYTRYIRTSRQSIARAQQLLNSI